MLTKKNFIKLTLIAFLSVFLTQHCSENEQNPQIPQTLNDSDSAYQFSLRVIETYFTRDSLLFRTYLADTIYTLENDTPILSSNLNLNKIFSSSNDYSMYTLDDYLSTYIPEIHYQDSVVNFFDSTLTTWSIGSSDYIFWGSKVKHDKVEFIWSDLLLFVVTNENGTWKLKAFSG